MEITERFEKYYSPEPNTGCWLWTGGGMGTHREYGAFQVDNKAKLAHRVSYELFVGPIPDGMFVCHQCDVACCVNPEHLFLGTAADNSADMVRKGRSAKGENHSQSKLTESEAQLIRSAIGTQREIAKRFGVSQNTVWQIKRGNYWGHVK